MAIIQNCCFWRSLRRASFACGFYTLIYFITTCITMTLYLNEEKQYLKGEVDAPQGESILEKEKISSTTVIFYILLLICESIGIVSSIILIIGLHLTKFEPLTAIIFTIDFFVLCLNIYCLVCVISQYQEYKAGRGAAGENFSSFNGNVKYVPPTQTACLNNIKQAKAILSPVCQHTNFSSIPEEPSTHGNFSAVQRSPFHRRTSSILRKHVKFPDENKACDQTAILNEIKLQRKINEIETLPEYSEDILSWHEQNNNKSSIYE